MSERESELNLSTLTKIITKRNWWRTLYALTFNGRNKFIASVHENPKTTESQKQRKKKKKNYRGNWIEEKRESIGTLKEREWTAWDNASPSASEKPRMKGKSESSETILWAWASTSSASSTASLSAWKSIFSLCFLSPEALEFWQWRSLGGVLLLLWVCDVML